MNRAILEEILAARRDKRPVALITWIESGRQTLLSSNTSAIAGNGHGLDASITQAAEKALREDRSHSFETDSGTVFVQAINPPLRMIIVGAVHITQVLAPMATLLGYEVIVVDPRRAFASSDRFPRVTVVQDWPDEALDRLVPDRRSAVVTLTHDPKLDDPALGVALRSKAFYIASLGSKRTHAQRLDRLRRAGFDEEDFKRIRGPAGLDIGARTPAEIATAILAQATQALRRGTSP